MSNTIEDTLTEDLADYWNANRPAELPEGWSIYHARREGVRELPCVVIGHEGCQRVPGMPDTGRVALRVMALSGTDQTSPAVHRSVAGIMDGALEALISGTKFPGLIQPLARCHLHEFLLESPDSAVVEGKRQEYTVLKRTAVASRYV